MRTSFAAHLLAFCVVVALTLAGTAMGEVSRGGLVGEWLFDGDAKDTSGNGNDGTINGGAAFVDGVRGKALSFDGVDDYVGLGSWFDYQTFTISMWVNPAVNQVDWANIIDNNHGGPVSRSWELQQNGNSLNKYLWGPADGYCASSANDCINFNLNANKWTQIVLTRDGNTRLNAVYINGALLSSVMGPGDIPYDGTQFIRLGKWDQGGRNWNGKIDGVRIYNRALTASEIKELYEGEQTALSITKSVSPTSIKQGQTAAITLSVKNTGTTEIKDIEIKDTIPADVNYISGETSKTYSSLTPKDSREFQYIVQINQAGTFNLGSAAATFADEKGNYQKTKSNAAALEVIPSIAAPTPTLVATTPEPESSAVLLHGEKTDVVLGEDVLLKLSAVNLITKPPMTVQVMIYPPSGMSVTSSEFVKSGAGIYTTTYSLNRGEGRDIEVRIKTNQVGDFNVKGRIVYYFGDNQSTAEDHTLNLPIKVRKEDASAQNEETPAQKQTPGFGIIISISAVLFIFLKKRGIKE